MELKDENPLPKKLLGAVCEQWVRCGKPRCKCAHGELHGPYFYRFVRRGGRQRKVYVRLAEAERVRAACELNRQEVNRRREERLQARQCLRTLLADLRQIERAITRVGEE
jgi:hypothetical protein